MNKHTPGPWSARKAPERNAYAWDVEGAQGTVPTIARMALVDRVAEVEANAHLIAAAPVVYRELENVPLPKHNEEASDFYTRFYTWYEGSRKAALAQADGE